jgi:hypothetical protein
MPSVLTWIGRVALGVGLAAVAVIAVSIVGPLAVDGLAALARPHGV